MEDCLLYSGCKFDVHFLSCFSFDVVQFVYEKLLDMKGNIGSIPVVLVGNKCDLTYER